MPEALARQLAELESGSTAELRARWEWVSFLKTLSAAETLVFSTEAG